MDSGIANLTLALRAKQMYDNTLIIFTVRATAPFLSVCCALEQHRLFVSAFCERGRPPIEEMLWGQADNGGGMGGTEPSNNFP